MYSSMSWDRMDRTAGLGRDCSRIGLIVWSLGHINVCQIRPRQSEIFLDLRNLRNLRETNKKA